MTTITEIPKDWSLLEACSLRPETIAHDNYAADLHSSLESELAVPESARQFFQSTYPTEGLSEVCWMIFNRLADGNERGAHRMIRGLQAIEDRQRYPNTLTLPSTESSCEFLPAGKTLVLPGPR